jgi:hypothetical protein
MSKTTNSTTAQEDEAIDLEEAAQEGRKPPRGRQYRVRVDDEKHLVGDDVVTGREILETAGREPVDDYVLILRLWDEPNEIIDLDEEVNLARRGVERFVTGREDDEIVVTVFAPRVHRPKEFCWDEDILVRDAAQEAADEFGYNAGSPGLEERGEDGEALNGDQSLEEAGVEHGDALELFDTGGGVQR